MRALIILVVFLCTCASALSADAETYILNVFSANSTLLACDALSNRVSCELTELCYWHVDLLDSTVNNTCAPKKVFFEVGVVEPLPDRSWCYEFFPLPFIAIIFFLAAFIAGASLVGVIYCYLYFDVFSKRLKTGEIVYNQFHYKTWPIVSYCGLLFGCCMSLAITAWLYWINERICAYVVFTFIFLIAMGVGIIGYPVYKLVRYIQETWFENDESGLELEQYIMPQTLQALPSRANQVRCF